MPNKPDNPGSSSPEKAATAGALDRLRLGSNPFANQVAAVGSAEESLMVGIPEFAADQLAELLEIIGLYRGSQTATRIYPLLGRRGTGKTHLLYQLREELREETGETGRETLIVFVERLSPGMDAIDYLLWQIVNHLLTQRGEGERMLGVIAGRLTARLLAESLRQLGPHQRAELIPSEGFWSRLGVGAASRTQAKLDSIEAVVQCCDGKNATSDDLRSALDLAGLKPSAALDAIKGHLERTESKDVLGWLRKELYTALACVALLRDRDAFDELQNSDYRSAPASVKNTEHFGRRVLDVWLELLSVLGIPVVVVFDQMEDYLRHPNPEQEKEYRRFFTDAMTRFVNELRSVCILIFVEDLLWTDLLQRTESYTVQRLTQPFALPGRAAKPHILMPIHLDVEMLRKLVRKRIMTSFADLDLTGLSPAFPFQDSDLEEIAFGYSVRDCLRRLSPRYDQIVYGPRVEPHKIDLKKILRELWNREMQLVAREKGKDWAAKSTAAIPEFQNAIDGWLQCLHQYGLTGASPWSKVELISDTKMKQYGYLNVIRVEGPNAPGIGIAFWLGEGRAKPHDLENRIHFFRSNPCPIKTLVLLRADGKDAVESGNTKDIYDEAVKKGRDIRIQSYQSRHLHALTAFNPWLQLANEETRKAKEVDPAADGQFREFLGELSAEVLGWIDGWRGPNPAAAAAGGGST